MSAASCIPSSALNFCHQFFLLLGSMGSKIPAQDEANRAPKTQLCTEAETSSDLQAKAMLNVSFRALKFTEESEISSLLLKSSFPGRADAETFFLLFFFSLLQT